MLWNILVRLVFDQDCDNNFPCLVHSNQPAERFRTDILTQIRAADSEYTVGYGILKGGR